MEDPVLHVLQVFPSKQVLHELKHLLAVLSADKKNPVIASKH